MMFLCRQKEPEMVISKLTMEFLLFYFFNLSTHNCLLNSQKWLETDYMVPISPNFLSYNHLYNRVNNTSDLMKLSIKAYLFRISLD